MLPRFEVGTHNSITASVAMGLLAALRICGDTRAVLWARNYTLSPTALAVSATAPLPLAVTWPHSFLDHLGLRGCDVQQQQEQRARHRVSADFPMCADAKPTAFPTRGRNRRVTC